MVGSGLTVAKVHKILIGADHMLQDGSDFMDFGTIPIVPADKTLVRQP